jgi:hypothetical protein
MENYSLLLVASKGLNRQAGKRGRSQRVREWGGGGALLRCPHSPSASSRGARTDRLTDSLRGRAAEGARTPGVQGQPSPFHPVVPRPVPSGPMAPSEARSPGGAG